MLALDSVMYPDPIQAARIQTRYFMAIFFIVLASLPLRGIDFIIYVLSIKF